MDLGVVAATNGKIYAIGGWASGGVSGMVEEYDTATDSWTTRTSMPTPRDNLGAVAARNGKIYTFGGWNGGAAGAVEEYDPLTDTWRSRAGMPTARWALGAAEARNGKIYVIGGQGFCTYSPCSTVEEYDPATDTWTPRASIHVGKYGLGVAATAGKLYAIGGHTNNESATVEAAVIPVEPSDSFDQATALEPGIGAADSIEAATDVDYYTFRVDFVPASIQLSLTDLPANYDLYLYGPDRALLGSSARTGTLGEGIDTILTVPGTYYVKVVSSSGAFSSSPYRLALDLVEPTPTPPPTRTATASPTPTSTGTATVTPTPTATQADPYEPNNSYTQAYALSSGQGISARLYPAGDADFFKVYVGQAGTTVTVTLSGLPANYDLFLDRPDQMSAAASTNPGTANEQIVYPVGSVTGYYYVVVMPASTEASLANYTLSVVVSGSGGQPSATPTPTATPLASPTATATPLSGPSLVEIDLVPGWNLVSLPYSTTLPYHASHLVASLQARSFGVVHVARWRDGGWQSYLPGFGPEDFLIEPGRGYFVRLSNGGRWRP